VAFRRDWLRTIPASMGKVGFAVALGGTILLFPPALLSKTLFLGGGTWRSGVYALWDSTFAVGVCLGLIALFRGVLNRTGWLSRFLFRHAYTVYITHPLIVVGLALALRPMHPEQLIKLALVALLAVPLSFAAACVLRKVPVASWVLCVQVPGRQCHPNMSVKTREGETQRRTRDSHRDLLEGPFTVASATVAY
jgi:glucan biosynthesis protein C